MKYKYWLSNLNGVGNIKIKRLLEYFEEEQAIYEAKEEELKCVYGITEKDAKGIVKQQMDWDLDGAWMKFLEEGIGFVCQSMAEYPSKLLHIADAPYSIYYKGKLPDASKKSVAIVGARGRSAYGSAFAESLAKELALNHIDVISGLALGIDSDSHKGALHGGGNTYGVLGCGVKEIYPKSNGYLYEQVIAHGGVLSEYPPDTLPNPGYFPARNRIISGLSDYVVIIEARVKSGSLITADYALEQGKDIYALPGRVTDPLSAGTNQLIKQGAGIILSVEDFIRDIMDFPEYKGTQLDFRKNLLEKDEGLVYSLLDFCPVNIGTIMESTSFSLEHILKILGRLEELGFAKEILPNYYVKTMMGQ